MKRNLSGAALAVVLLACGGSTSSPASPLATVNVSALTLASAITRVALEVQPANIQQDLTFDATAATFSGSLQVPRGTQTFTARAYRMDGATEVLVGSDEETVTIVAGATASVRFVILDASGPAPAPRRGPIITSASASNTHPIVGDAVTLSMTAVDPDGDPVSYSWSADSACAGTFSTRTAATTTFTPTAVGSCTVNGLALNAGGADGVGFVLVVSSGEGTADVSGIFVVQPVIERIRVETSRDVLTTSRAGSGNVNTLNLLTGQPLTVRAEAAVGPHQSGLAFSVTDTCGGAASPVDVSVSPEGVATGMFQWSTSTAGVCTIRIRVSNHGLTDEFPLGLAAWAPPCPVDDAYEPNNDPGSAVYVRAEAAETREIVRNDEDWFNVQVFGTATSLTVTSDATTPIEIFRLDFSTNGYELLGSGTGTASAPADPSSILRVRFLPGPSCTTATTSVTFTPAP